jgi:uncharacterized protein (TIGR02996 family)
MNEQTFLAALHEAPDDEVTWLALADWLDESGQPQRAELVRLGRALRQRRLAEREQAETRLAALLIGGVHPVVPERVNTVGMRLALIPPGRFLMGSPAEEADRAEDEKAREVELTRPFYLGVFAVTQAQYEAVMGENAASFRAGGRNRSKVTGLDTSAFPVDQITWEQAADFCARLSQREPGLVYRLPNEAEWEYACRAGTTTAYHFGDAISLELANYDGSRAKRGRPRPLARPCAVGDYPPNAFGLYDLHGNVMEWCDDWYAPAPPGRGRRAVSPPPTGQYRVVKGGCWYFPASAVRSASRNFFSPAARDSCVGFRVAMTPG